MSVKEGSPWLEARKFCPFCGTRRAKNTKVFPTRSGGILWRNTKCLTCGNVISSVNVIERWA